VQNSLISFYGKCGDAAMARRVFDQMDAEKTTTSWSALLSASTRAGLWTQCIDSFGVMVREGRWRPDESSMVSALSTCVHLGTYDLGRSVHGVLLRNAVALNTIIRTSLVDINAGAS
jgi:pentatricopeptide repeat protein